MANSNSTMIHKLQQAINSRGYKILYSTSQFYSDKQNRPITQHIIKQVVPDDDPTKRNHHIELFKTCSQIQVVLFLRDFWYEINGWEIPKDNEFWEEAKKKYQEKQCSNIQGE
jgi:hypothetical protein